jgi:hypothetical protein
MKILKEHSYEQQETQITNHSRNWEGFIKSFFASNLFKSFGFLKHCLLFRQWSFFRTRGPGSSKTFKLHYLAVVRQVHSCSYLMIIFKSTQLRSISYQLHQILLSNELVDDGTID